RKEAKAHALHIAIHQKFSSHSHRGNKKGKRGRREKENTEQPSSFFPFTHFTLSPLFKGISRLLRPAPSQARMYPQFAGNPLASQSMSCDCLRPFPYKLRGRRHQARSL